jgi:signal transduction histidine kinase
MRESASALNHARARRGLGYMRSLMSLGVDTPAILMVDDHPANLIALEAVLRPLGYRLVPARSGDEALLEAQQQDFVLIFMDVHMPGLDGYETVERLRSRSKSREVPILFLTAVYNLEEHAHRGFALGAADYITKPFDPVALRAKVASLVGLYTRGRREEQERREAMDRLKDLFLGAVNHDLRAPLHSILLGARLIKDRATPDEARRGHGSAIERSALRMNAMVDDILDLTAEKFTGTLPLRLEETDLGLVCRSVVAEMQAVHAGRAIDVEVSDKVLGTWDATRLARIIGNLVGNAIQHADGRVVVRILGDAENAHIIVQNGGPPIPPAVLPSLFEPFRRGDKSPAGYGLGLYIVREIARAHGGDLGVRSSEAEGTCFTVTLPRRPPPSDGRLS